jgi:hypothetical protein
MAPSSVHAGSGGGWAHAAVALGLILGVLFPGQAGAAGNRPADHTDPAIRRALSLLPVPVDETVTIEVIALRELSKPDRHLLRQVCAFVRPGVPHILIVPTCPAYRGAETSLFEAIKLAGILRHELAHVAGAGEREARRQESKAVRLMLRRAPAEHQTPGMLYAADLDARAANGDP